MNLDHLLVSFCVGSQKLELEPTDLLMSPCYSERTSSFVSGTSKYEPSIFMGLS